MLCTRQLQGGVAALQDAAERGDVEALSALLENPPEAGVDLHSALLAAATAGQVNAVRLVCELPPAYGVDLSEDDNAVLRTAANEGHLEVIRYLCGLPRARAVDPGSHGNHCIITAAEFGDTEVVQFLCDLPAERGVDPAVSRNAPIRLAAQQGHLEVVRLLCALPTERGIDPSAGKNYALTHAAREGHVEVVQFLLSLPPERGVDVCAEDNEALDNAAGADHPLLVRWLIDHGADPSSRQCSVLSCAAAHDDLDLAKYLCNLPLERGVKPGQPCVLNSAISLEMVRYLCELPASRGVHPGADSYAIINAASRGDLDMVRYLCDLPPERGVNVAARDNCPVQAAVTCGNIDVLRFLLRFSDRGVAITADDVCMAAKRGVDVEVLDLLFHRPEQHGIDATVKRRVLEIVAHHNKLHHLLCYVCNLPPSIGVSTADIQTLLAPRDYHCNECRVRAQSIAKEALAWRRHRTVLLLSRMRCGERAWCHALTCHT